MIDSMTSKDILSLSNHNMNNGEHIQQKRFRSGSISGRLRTASDLEESGFIDKNQKGILKDLIISGDHQLQTALDKYEKGDTQELSELIRKGLFQRKDSIDILENLDFDFLNVVTAKRDRFNSLDDNMVMGQMLDDHISSDTSAMGYLDTLRPQRSDSLNDPNFPSHIFTEDFEKERIGRNRNTSMDSSHSFKIFDYLNSIGFDDDHHHHQQQQHHPNNNHPNNHHQQDAGGGTSTTSYPFGSQATVSGNRVVQAFTSRRDSGSVDMSAYTAVARTLQSTPGKPPITSSTRTTKLTLPSSSSSNTHMITTKEKPPTMLSPQFSLCMIPGSAGGTPSATKHSDNPDNKGVVGAYTMEQRRKRIDKFLEKRNRRVWTKKVKYDVRKNFADSRLRVKGRFVKKEEEHIMRELLDI